MRLRSILIIFKKELIDIARDRRAMIVMVVLPVLLIPGIMFVMNKFISSGVRNLREEASIVAVIGGEQAPSMVTMLGGLGDALDDPTFLSRVNDPMLGRGLSFMMRSDEMADAALAAPTLSTALREEDVGSARFLAVHPFAAVSDEGRTLFAQGPPSLLRDGSRLRLVATAERLRREAAHGDEVEKQTDSTPSDLDPALLADRARIENMSAADRALLDADVERYTALRREVVAGIGRRDYHAVLVLHDGFGEALHGDGTARYSLLFDESV